MQIDFLSLFTISYVFEWAIRAAMLFVVPRNRKPSSATAWLVLIMVTPFFGLIAFLLIGGPKLSKRRRKIQKHMDKVIQKYLITLKCSPNTSDYFFDSQNSKFAKLDKLNTKLGGFPIFRFNNIKLYDDYYQIFDNLIIDINNAKKYINIEFYILALDERTEAFFESLKAAVSRGVNVRILFDPIGSRRLPNYRAMKKKLRAIGVEWHRMLPVGKPGPGFNRLDLRNHRKIVVVDGLYAYTGSQNIVARNYHRRDNLVYDELVAKIEGPTVLQLNAVFINDWFSETQELLDFDMNCPNSNSQKSDNDLAQIIPSGPAYRNENNLKFFTSLIHYAEKRITIINPYFVPDDSLMLAITSAAQRGVEVTLINSAAMDQKLVGHAQRSYYEELLAAGVKIYLYKEPVLLHAKSITIDNDIAVIGSSNLDIRSFQLNLEVTLVVYNEDSVKKLIALEQKYIHNSVLVSPKAWRHRPVKSILLDNLARLTAALQ